MVDQVIAHSTAEATVRALATAIDLTDWIFTLTDSEYQACSKHHIAAATTFTPEGKRTSINVEHVGNLMVQHYVEDVAERSACRLVSLSDSIGPDIASKVQVVVIWSFEARAIDGVTTRFTNTVEVRTAPGYLEALQKRSVPFDKASERVQLAIHAHNAEETPLFAKDIERKALEGRWSR